MHTYRVFQGFRPNLFNLNKSIIFGSLLTTFKDIFEADEAIAKIGSTLKHNSKLRFSKTLMHTVAWVGSFESWNKALGMEISAKNSEEF